MTEETDKIESQLATSLPQFRTKEEVMENVRKRVEIGRQQRSTDGAEGNAITGNSVRGAIRGIQERIGSRTNDGSGTDEQGGSAVSSGRGAPSVIYAGDGRDASGEGVPDGYTYESPGWNRQSTNNSSSTYQRDRSTDRPGEQEVHAPPRRSSIGTTIRSKFKPFTDALNAPPKKPPSQTKQSSKQKAPPASAARKRTLSSTEAADIRPRLIEYLTWQSEHLDQFIIATTKGHDPTIMIWSDLTPEEIELTADFLLARGQSDVITAQAVRYAATLLDRIRMAIIYAPRIYRTVSIYLARGIAISIWVR